MQRKQTFFRCVIVFLEGLPRALRALAMTEKESVIARSEATKQSLCCSFPCHCERSEAIPLLWPKKEIATRPSGARNDGIREWASQ
jgi:hypothetical protein